jgi:1-acyl-sn-glycerol-3-phosphate acyltransferase
VLPVEAPAILYANHHGWFDGYLMYHVVRALGLKSLDWIEEFDAFPLFSKVGGMRFAAGDPIGRAVTIRRTIQRMRKEKVSLILFPEGVLHRPPSLLPFGGAIDLVARKVPGVTLVPVGIRYEMSLHERPEAWISVGEGSPGCTDADSLRARLQCELDRLDEDLLDARPFEILARGTPDVNERYDMRRMR